MGRHDESIGLSFEAGQPRVEIPARRVGVAREGFPRPWGPAYCLVL